MKQALLILFAVISINCYGQTKKDSSQKSNSVKVDSLNRDSKFLSIGDIYRLYDLLSDKIVVKDARVFENILQAILNQAVAEYYDKQKQLPKK